MAKAKKLPSGNWRVQAYIGKDPSGKRVYKSFTADTKREAEYMAAEFLQNHKEVTAKGKTLGTAMDEYISMKENVLSPATVKLYKSYKRNHFTEMAELPVAEITRQMVQEYISDLAKDHSPKTVSNCHGFLASVLKEFRPDLVLNTKLPQKKKHEMSIPDKADLQKLLDAAEAKEDKSLYLAILLASHMGLRRGEVCALEWSDISFQTCEVSISKAYTVNEDEVFVLKDPKSFSGNRKVPIPSYVCEQLKKYRKDSGPVVPLTPNGLSNQYKKMKAKIGLSQYSYHNLRHYYASVLLALGIPDKYAQEFMGHATNNMLKQVYQHTMDEKKQEAAKLIDSYFSS